MKKYGKITIGSGTMKKINKLAFNTVILSVIIFIIEIIFKIISHQNLIDFSIIRILLSSIFLGLIIAYIELFLKDQTAKKINILLTILISIYAFAQVGFRNFIGVYFSFNISSQAKAVTSYIIDFFKSFYWYYYLLIIPLLLIILFYKLVNKKRIKIKIENNDTRLRSSVILVSFLLVIGFLYYLTISLNIFQNQLQTIKNKDLFNYPSNPTIAIKQFGNTVYGLLDIKSIFIQSNNEIIDTHPFAYNNDDNNADDQEWKELIANEEDLVLNSLNQYFINNKKTTANSYTGLFENKNLIVIMMESVNDIFINEELYPNFYRLVNNGYYFKNNYSPRNSCATGNNELSGMIGLFSVYNKCTANVYSNNLYPESIFNLFNNKGYNTLSMHDYNERYYQRRQIHANMGSGNYYDVDDLKLEYNTKYDEWASDEEFMMEVVKKLKAYKSSDKFMMWLTTVTSHQPYGSSLYGDKYLYLLENEKYNNYDIKLKRYMSKLKVLDEGLGVLLNGLEKQNKLDNTVIILYGDHYPYGLSTNILKEALPYSIDEKYEVERVPFVIWSNDIEATTFNQWTSYINVTPTVANLFNLDYDSRYYVGDDLFSNTYQSMTIFADSSWKNEIGFYDASNNNMTYYGNKNYTIEDLIKINQQIEDKIKYSNLAIQHDYFNYLNSKLKK